MSSNVSEQPMIRRALISVSDKQGVAAFAAQLHEEGIQILSTGGTATLLRNEGIPVVDVSDVTAFPEIMDGRVKTLHPKIHGGLLGRRGVDNDVMKQHGIEAIDLLLVNLYPFQEVINDPQCDLERAIEHIDIGGPTMIRAAAKNHSAVTVLVNKDDYEFVLREIQENQGFVSEASRLALAKKAFVHTAQYEAAIANYFEKQTREGDFPDSYSCQFTKLQELRYGENPHQRGVFYKEPNAQGASIVSSTQLQGKALSFNNIADADAALECVRHFKTDPACVIVKHANPCGVALADSTLSAYQRAFKTDSTSSFGGIIAFNQTLKEDTAKAIVEQQFVEVIIAPKIEQTALDVLSEKSNIRVLSCGELQEQKITLDYRSVNGGLLVQDDDIKHDDVSGFEAVTKAQPTEQQMNDLIFAWQVARHVKSNAIVYARDRATIGIGAGQMSRVYSAKIGIMKAEDAGLSVQGSVMASDAFFPFRDSIDAAAKAGIAAIIQPGGSIRDQEVIDAANENGIAMVFTNIRHFKH